MRHKRTPIFSVVLIVLITLFLLTPLIATFINSLFADFTTIVPKGFTFQFFSQIFAGTDSMLPAVGRSLLISVIPTLVVLVLLLFAMFVIKVYYPGLDKYLDLLSKIPYGIQGVILAVSIISLFGALPFFGSNRVILLGAAYCIVILPYMYQGIKNALSTIEMMPILEAAEVLGSSKFHAYMTIVVPSILNGLMATIILSITILFGDFVLVNIIAGSYYETVGIFLHEIQGKSSHAASAVSVVIFLTMLLLSLTSNYLRHRAARGGKK